MRDQNFATRASSGRIIHPTAAGIVCIHTLRWLAQLYFVYIPGADRCRGVEKRPSLAARYLTRALQPWVSGALLLLVLPANCNLDDVSTSFTNMCISTDWPARTRTRSSVFRWIIGGCIRDGWRSCCKRTGDADQCLRRNRRRYAALLFSHQQVTRLHFVRTLKKPIFILLTTHPAHRLRFI